MKIINNATLDLFRGPGRCALCGWGAQVLDPHHVMTRGNNGSDIRINLVSVCRKCHTKRADTAIGWTECIASIAAREKCTTMEVCDANDIICFLDKAPSTERLLQAINEADLSPRAREMVLETLAEAGKLPKG